MSMNGYLMVLISVIDVLKEQGLESAGTCEALNPYQALKEAEMMAEALMCRWMKAVLRDSIWMRC